ncbi:hypothetical protein BH10PLA2_BH10PLA2_00030 [soil metagenome]
MMRGYRSFHSADGGTGGQRLHMAMVGERQHEGQEEKEDRQCAAAPKPASPLSPEDHYDGEGERCAGKREHDIVIEWLLCRVEYFGH